MKVLLIPSATQAYLVKVGAGVALESTSSLDMSQVTNLLVLPAVGVNGIEPFLTVYRTVVLTSLLHAPQIAG